MGSGHGCGAGDARGEAAKLEEVDHTSWSIASSAVVAAAASTAMSAAAVVGAAVGAARLETSSGTSGHEGE